MQPGGNRFGRAFALPLAVLALAVGAAACGGNGDGTETSPEPTTATGRTVFVDNCGSCHTLADAGTTGVTGPNLDEADVTVDAVEQQVREGGGEMPAFAGALSDEEIAAVAGYVVDAQAG